MPEQTKLQQMIANAQKKLESNNGRFQMAQPKNNVVRIKQPDADEGEIFVRILPSVDAVKGTGVDIWTAYSKIGVTFADGSAKGAYRGTYLTTPQGQERDEFDNYLRELNADNKLLGYGNVTGKVYPRNRILFNVVQYFLDPQTKTYKPKMDENGQPLGLQALDLPQKQGERILEILSDDDVNEVLPEDAQFGIVSLENSLPIRIKMDKENKYTIEAKALPKHLLGSIPVDYYLEKADDFTQMTVSSFQTDATILDNLKSEEAKLLGAPAAEAITADPFATATDKSEPLSEVDPFSAPVPKTTPATPESDTVDAQPLSGDAADFMNSIGEKTTPDVSDEDLPF